MTTGLRRILLNVKTALRGDIRDAHLAVGDWDDDIINPVDQVALFAQMNAIVVGEPRMGPKAEPKSAVQRMLLHCQRTNGTELGAVIELVAGRGLAYLHVTHFHALQPALGPVVRVLSGFSHGVQPT